jgi:hypothetical protein
MQAYPARKTTKFLRLGTVSELALVAEAVAGSATPAVSETSGFLSRAFPGISMAPVGIRGHVTGRALLGADRRRSGWSGTLQRWESIGRTCILGESVIQMRGREAQHSAHVRSAQDHISANVKVGLRPRVCERG